MKVLNIHEVGDVRLDDYALPEALLLCHSVEAFDLDLDFGRN